MNHTPGTPDALPPDERRMLESVVTLIAAHIKQAKGESVMVQKQLPNMPRPVEPDYRPVQEYRLTEDLGNRLYGLVSPDGDTLAYVMIPQSDGKGWLTSDQREMRVMLVSAIVEH